MSEETDNQEAGAVDDWAEAMADAGLPEHLEDVDAQRTGFFIGSGLGGNGTLVDQIGEGSRRGADHVSPFFIPMAIANMASAQAAIDCGAQGPNYSTTSACASSGHAIGEATETILAAKGDSREHLAYENADLWFHTLVMLADQGLGPDDVLRELDRRFGLSGLEEKAARSK